MSLAPSPGLDTAPIVAVEGLCVTYRVRHGEVLAVNDVSFSVGKGEIFGLVGETGSGKSTVLRAIIGLLHPNARVTNGTVAVGGENVVGLSPRVLQQLRRRHMAMVFQDPLRSLNPVLTVEEQIGEGLRARGEIGRRAVRRQVIETMDIVGIPDATRRLRAYPHELSGGLQQRVAIAAAIIRSPDLILADEPTTALDVTIQDQILSLLRGLCQSLGMSVVLVTHDIGVVAETCDRMGVMYAGRMIELGRVERLLTGPSHPYTAGLLASIRRIGAPKARLQAIPGAPPDLSMTIVGCPFAPRCGYRIDECRTLTLRLEQHGPDQLSACLRHAELAGQLSPVAS